MFKNREYKVAGLIDYEQGLLFGNWKIECGGSISEENEEICIRNVLPSLTQ